MKINDPQITQIVKNKYPLEITSIIPELNENQCRFFTDDYGNHVVLEVDEEDDLFIVTLFHGSLSPNNAFDERNGGVFFITNDIPEFKQLFNMNLVFYSQGELNDEK